MGIPARNKRLSFLAFRLVTRDTVALANELKTAASPGEPNDGLPYYEHWLAALEHPVTAKGLADPASPVYCNKADARDAR
jgi:hypothetical protein